MSARAYAPGCNCRACWAAACDEIRASSLHRALRLRADGEAAGRDGWRRQAARHRRAARLWRAGWDGRRLYGRQADLLRGLLVTQL